MSQSGDDGAGKTMLKRFATNRSDRSKAQDSAGQIMNEKGGHRKSDHTAAGRRRAAGKSSRKYDGGEEASLNKMGVMYNKVLNFSIVTRYFLYILPLAILISIPIIIGATAAPNAELGGVRIVWIFAWLLIVWLSLWVSKLVAKILPPVFQFMCGIVSSGTRKYAMVLKSLEIYLSLCGWALASLATFIPVMTRNPTQRAEASAYDQYHNSTNPTQKANALLFADATGIKPWESVIQKILAALLIASLILLVEKFFIQIISIGYHRTQFVQKIHESKAKIHLLGLLYEASRTAFPPYCPEFAEEDYIINDSLDIAGVGNRQSGSVTPARLIQDVGRFGGKLTSAFGNIASEVTGKQVFNPNSSHSVVIEALERNRSSEALAKRIWMSFVVEGEEALFRDDLIEVLGPTQKDAADDSFDMLDCDGNGDVSLDEMILTVCDLGKERRSIADSLHDVDQAITVLDGLLCAVVFIVVIFVFVAFLNTSFTTTLATAGTALLSLSFVFAGTAQEVLGSCIFLFVKHPFDVLDRVDIGKDQLVVKQISLLFTVFKHVDTHKLTQVPNITLNTLWIQNVSRSDAMRERLSIYISFDTTLEDIQLLKNELNAFVADKENSRDFQPEVDVEITGLASMDKMELKVEIRHKSNWSNETVRAARRSKFMCALVLALRKIPINAPGGGGAVLGSEDKPTYSVAVSDDQAATNRAAFDKAKDNKRLFPSSAVAPSNKSSVSGPAGENNGDSSVIRDSAAPPPLRFRQAPSESAALTSLNTRRPAADTAIHHSDQIEPTTPRSHKSLTRSVSGADALPDLDRDVSIEEVRGMLRRQSTRGKRQAGSGPASLASPIISMQTSLPTYMGGKFEYDPYAPHSSQSPTAASARKGSMAASSLRNQSSNVPEKDTRWPKPPANSYAPQGTDVERQRTTMAQTQLETIRSAPASNTSRADLNAALPGQTYTPTPPPKGMPASVPRPSTESQSQNLNAQKLYPYRAESPVQNPYQLQALRNQAQGSGAVPKAVRTEMPSRPESPSMQALPTLPSAAMPMHPSIPAPPYPQNQAQNSAPQQQSPQQRRPVAGHGMGSGSMSGSSPMGPRAEQQVSPMIRPKRGDSLNKGGPGAR